MKNIDARSKGYIVLTIVVPVFNESETVTIFIDRVFKTFNGINHIKLDILFINDGSTDNTLDLLIELKDKYSEIRIIDLSRNFGKEAALTAGLKESLGNVVVPIDVDLQDPPELILQMILMWKKGYDVVLGKRINRDADSLIKRKTASFFYYIHNKISDINIPENVGDFRLMDRSVVDEINKLPESRRFMKGIFAWVGFRTCQIQYSRPKRIAGSTKFSTWRLLNFALEGITSHSTIPLKIATYFGFSMALLSFLYGIIIISKVLFYGIDVPGFASVIVSVIFFGGLQLIFLGILGEYLGRSYIESKRRPVYLIRRIY